LSGRQPPQWQAALLAQSDASERSGEVRRGEAPAQPQLKAQILGGREVALEAIVMAEVGELAVVGAWIESDVRAAPADPSLLERHEPAQRAQQRGLARAIGAGDLQAFTTVHDKGQAAQHVHFTAPQMQVFGRDVVHVVRTAGVEPTLPFGEADFKSAASTGFATSADVETRLGRPDNFLL
jgi:hypothetical protein